MRILVTGSAGFIGFHLAKKLIERGDQVIGLDNISDYYDVNLKLARLRQLGIPSDQIKDKNIIINSNNSSFCFIKSDLEDKDNLSKLFAKFKFDAVCNLAAQAGVRYSLSNPHAYIQANIVGFLNILEACRNYQVENLSFASSSSVYGLNTGFPFKASGHADHPISLYAASKKSNELMAHSYSHLYGIKTTGLRFFTVYGPWGRPDMALFIFTKAAFENKEIEIYNNGEMYRDFTYIDDIIEGVIRVIDSPATPNHFWDADTPDPSSSSAAYRIYNIGNNNPVRLLDFVDEIESIVGKKIKRKFLPIQPGDVSKTYADVNDLIKNFDYQPNTSIQFGISKFIDWYKNYYEIH